MVTEHATLVHLLKQTSDKLIDMQSHWVENLSPYANLMRILYKEGIFNETDSVSRCPDFLSIDNMYMLDESLWWDGKVPSIDTKGNGPALLELSTLEALNVEDDFLSSLKGAYSTCAYYSNENIKRRSRQNIKKSSYGLFIYHNRVVISRPANNLI